jgi:pimeloyl-ACP methyl ester carboxylesterase
MVKTYVNGIELYYEKAGGGPPIILLHGNGESSATFAELTSKLADDHTVFALDSRNHGKSGRSDKADYEDMADDVAAFIDALAIGRPVLFGFSDGGVTGLLIALSYPELLSKLIVAGANTRPDGLAAWFRLLMRGLHFINRSKLIRMMLEQPNITDKELEGIALPVLIIAGGRDIIREEHTREIAAAIPGSKLVILPGETHGSYMKKTDKLLTVIREAGFL